MGVDKVRLFSAVFTMVFGIELSAPKIKLATIVVITIVTAVTYTKTGIKLPTSFYVE